MQKEEDLRVRRTRKMLQRAFVELTIEKGFANVTVRELAERAMVNRSTFYRHYLDKYELLKQYLDDVYELINSQDGDVSSTPQPNQSPAGLVKLLKQMQKNSDFWRVMLSRQGDPAFCAESFRQYIESGLGRLFPPDVAQADPAQPPNNLIVSYVLHAGMGAILWWLEEGQSHTPEQVAIWLHQLSMANISQSLGSVDSGALSAD